jgi:MtrB/PioB family decaheme-associated outer membrane protein
MKMRAGLLVTCAASALAIGLGFASPVLAADVMPTKAPIAVADAWWYEGYAEIGGRFFLNNPDRRDLGKFYEYRDLRPGVFGNFFFGAHRAGIDPLDIEAWGKNIGWDDQAYGLDIAKPGTYYLTFGWDETPHVWSQKASSIWSGAGGTFLSVNRFSPGAPSAANAAVIVSGSVPIDLGIRRDTASAAARWTPTDNWDFDIDASHLHREGVQSGGAVSFSTAGGTRSTFEIPKPVDDTTTNAGLKGEYTGTTPWSTPFNIAVGGGYSNYRNDNSAVLFENPWNPTNTANGPRLNMYTLPPDNQASSFNVQGGVGLPFNSRYMGTFQFTRMTADASNLPYTVNPLVVFNPLFQNITPDRQTDTILFNNVLNTRLTETLTSTLKYRYYNYDAQNTPAFTTFFPGNPDSNSGNPDDEVHRHFPTSYTKQNLDAQLVWKAYKWLNLGASYDWEHWDRSYRAVSNSDENTGKVFLDSKWGFSTLRASLLYGQRRNGGYSDLAVNDSHTANNAAFRMKDLANRDRTRGQISWAVDVTRELTITPNAGFLHDDFRTDICFTAPGCEAGLKKADSWNAGVDATWTFNRMVAVMVAYNYETGYRQIYQNSATPPLNIETTDQNHTFIVGGRFTIIPGTLFLDVNYAHSFAVSHWLSSCTPAGCLAFPVGAFPIFPDTHNTNDRVDVQAKYVFDEAVTRGWGLWPKSQAYVKARVLWERNSNDAWQPLQAQSGFAIPGVVGTANTTTESFWLATGNPNYNVVLGQVAFGVKW